jgi:hypothetical protein
LQIGLAAVRFFRRQRKHRAKIIDRVLSATS